MDAIDLTGSETSTLRDVIQNYLTELHSEISHTDDRDFKAVLRRRHELLQRILQKLGAAVGATA